MKSEKLAILSIFFIVVGLMIIVGLLLPYFEMRSFNKFSKTKATYWDALVINLRVVPD